MANVYEKITGAAFNGWECKRMGESIVPKNKLYHQPRKAKKVGHPRNKWLDDVKIDFTRCIKRWKKKSGDRRE